MPREITLAQTIANNSLRVSLLCDICKNNNMEFDILATIQETQKHHQKDTIQSSLHALLMDNSFLSQKTSLQCPEVIVRWRRVVYFVRRSVP